MSTSDDHSFREPDPHGRPPVPDPNANETGPSYFESMYSDSIVRAEDLPAVVPVEPPPHPGFWWALLWCLGYLLVTQLVPGIVGAVALIVLLAREPEGLKVANLNNPQALAESDAFSMAMMPAMLFAQVLSIAGSWLAIRLVVGREWPRILGLRWPGLTHLVLAVIGLPGLMFLAVGIDGVAKEHLPSLIDLEDTMKLFAKWPWPIGVLIIGVGPGIGEELWCRGFLGRGLVGRHGVIGGVLLTSFLFGLIHLEPRQLIYAGFMGILLHLSYLATRSLLVPIILHTCNNSLSVVAAQFTPKEALDTPADQLPWHIFAAAALLVTAVGWSLFRSRARLVDLPSEDPFRWRPTYPGAAYPPSGSTTIVVRPRPDAASWIMVSLAVLLFIASAYLAITT
jgi:membrane protease YdiL (CAAX protease family)